MSTPLVLASLIASSGLTDAQIVDLFAHTESRYEHAAVGDSGRARSAWQMHRKAWLDVSIWRRVKKLPVYDYNMGIRDPEKARAYAGDYIGICAFRLNNLMGRQPTLEEVWCGWNMGVGRFYQIQFDKKKAPLPTRAGIARMHEYMKEKGWR